MKCKLYLILLMWPIFSISYGQIQAITEDGNEVTLHKDGTWEYVGEEPEIEEIALSKDTFSTPGGATFLMKSKKANFGFNINPKKWIVEKAAVNTDAEYQVRFKDSDIYGMIISEKVEIPVETLRNIVLDNARAGASEVKVLSEEYRIVNGNKVLSMTFQAKAQGIQFQYHGYYDSNESGTVQYLLFSSPAIMNTYKGEIQDLLNGLISRNNEDK